MIYAYCRVSTQHQKIARQITNITAIYPNATIVKEFYTGTKQDRPNWNKLINIIKKEDTIVFDSVSRMSRNAEEGFKDYKMLYERGVHLIFLNEPLINTSVFDSTRNNLLNIDITTGNAAVDTQYTDREGVVTHVDDAGQIHGTWGGCALIPEIDTFVILNHDSYIFDLSIFIKNITPKKAVSQSPPPYVYS